MTNDMEWNSKEDMFIEPCSCRSECGNHILFMKGKLTHFKDIKDEQFISTATLSLGEMIDLYKNLQESIDVEMNRRELEEQLRDS